MELITTNSGKVWNYWPATAWGSQGLGYTHKDSWVDYFTFDTAEVLRSCLNNLEENKVEYDHVSAFFAVAQDTDFAVSESQDGYRETRVLPAVPGWHQVRTIRYGMPVDRSKVDIPDAKWQGPFRTI